MKKIIFIVLIAIMAISLNSCSSSGDGSGKSTLTYKINGATKIFKVLPNRDGGEIFPYGYIGSVNSPTEVTEFVWEIGETGTKQIGMFYYISPNGHEYVPLTTLTFNVTSSTQTETKGTFSGTLRATGQSDVELTDGSFTLKY